MKLTLSVIKADIGGYVGHSESHPDIIAKAGEALAKAKKSGLLIDCYVTKCGDDLQLIMTHKHGVNNKEIHNLAWDTFVSGTELATVAPIWANSRTVPNPMPEAPPVTSAFFPERSARIMFNL